MAVASVHGGHAWLYIRAVYCVFVDYIGNTFMNATGAADVLTGSVKSLMSSITGNLPWSHWHHWHEIVIGIVAFIVIWFLLWYWANFLR